MSKLKHGNASDDSVQTRGWFVGSFMPNGELSQSDDVEIKYGDEKKGNARSDWVTDETRTSVCLLISGKMKLVFRDKDVILSKQGDYVMWGEGTDHKWEALEDSVCLTIRWSPSTK